MRGIPRKIPLSELLLILFLLLVSIFIFFESRSFPRPKNIIHGGGPGSYTIYLAVSLVLLSIILLGQSLVKRGQKDDPQEHPADPNGESTLFTKRYYSPILGSAMLIAYWLLLPLLHYIIATFVYLVAYILIFGDRKAGLVGIFWPLLYSAGLTAFIYLVFRTALLVPLP